MAPKPLLYDVHQKLKPFSDTPLLDAQLLLSHITDRPRSWILAHPDTPLSPQQCNQLADHVQQLQSGTPLPYILGEWEFYNLPFEVTPDVMIPRPETELLVEFAIHWLQKHPHRFQYADIGTGSGCIAISIAHHVPRAHFIASDINHNSLQVARRNVNRHRLQSRISLFQGHLAQALNGKFDLITANLPYVPRKKLVNLPVYGREPTRALDGGPDGLGIIRDFLSTAPEIIAAGGLLLLEIDESRGEQAAQLGTEFFPEAMISIEQDLSGLDRMLVIHTRTS